MGKNDDYFSNFKKENDESIKRAANMAKATLGSKASKVDELLNDPKKLEKITSKLTKKDMDKLSALLDDPESIARLLKNDKVKENIEKFLDNN